MHEGELLKSELRKKFSTLKRAIEQIEVSKPTLNKYLEMERIPTTFLETVEKKTGIKIRSDSSVITLEEKVARLELEISELKTHIINILTK